MNLADSPAEARFRDELRSWLRDNLPAGWGRTVFEPEAEEERAHFRLEWEKRLHRAGWNGIAWPKEYGGRGATLIEQAIFAEEMARANAPEGINIIGRNLTGPTLIHHGTEAQRRRFLPRILSCEDVWCQGFSEPNAGSDLASLKCRAVLDGDHFVVDGQKVWTSFAQYAQWCFLLVRTDAAAPKHKGISFLLVDMASPGISLRPIKQISGESEFNETFFDGVRVPAANLVGGLNEGWRIAMTTLAYERGPDDALGRQIRFKQELDQLLRTLVDVRRAGRGALEDPALRERLGKAVVELDVMRLTCLRSFSRILRGAPRGADASMIKLYWSHVMQEMYDMAMDVLGPAGTLQAGDALAPAAGRVASSWLESKAFTIYSGSSEIQRNIIAERVLGLPR
jgi:alkylation response protein AidB-like acyl-CoA dehydrogenase